MAEGLQVGWINVLDPASEVRLNAARRSGLRRKDLRYRTGLALVLLNPSRRLSLAGRIAATRPTPRSDGAS